MAGETTEVWANESTLVSFDGRVLEIFGFTDAHRYHRAFHPRMTVGKRMVTITDDHTGRWSFFYNSAHRDELERFAAALAESVGP